MEAEAEVEADFVMNDMFTLTHEQDPFDDAIANNNVSSTLSFPSYTYMHFSIWFRKFECYLLSKPSLILVMKFSVEHTRNSISFNHLCLVVYPSL